MRKQQRLSWLALVYVYWPVADVVACKAPGLAVVAVAAAPAAAVWDRWPASERARVAAAKLTSMSGSANHPVSTSAARETLCRSLAAPHAVGSRFVQGLTCAPPVATVAPAARTAAAAAMLRPAAVVAPVAAAVVWSPVVAAHAAAVQAAQRSPNP